MATSFIVGKKYTCNTDQLGGFVKQNATHNGKPTFNSSMALFSEGTTYTVGERVVGYNNAGLTEDTFYKMGSYYVTLAGHGWAFDGPVA